MNNDEILTKGIAIQAGRHAGDLPISIKAATSVMHAISGDILVRTRTAIAMVEAA